MDIIQNVFDISKEILDQPKKYVVLNYDKIDDLSAKMKEDGIPPVFGRMETKKQRLEVIKEIVASSINYCYWYGVHDIRPNNVSSQSMYEDVNKIFDPAKKQDLNFEFRIRKLIHLLSLHRYPLLEDRKRHLQGLCEGRMAEAFATEVIMDHDRESIMLFNDMIKLFQGFSSDIFLKRMSLFFLQLYRKFGWFEDLMDILFIPADYQVPKILRYFECIRFTSELEYIVDNQILIPKHCLMELQIRAGTIIACTNLQYKSGFNISDVDTYLWGNRKLTDKPFHQTITTDY